MIRGNRLDETIPVIAQLQTNEIINVRHSSNRDATYDVRNEIVCYECLPAVGPPEEIEQSHHRNESNV